MPGLPGEKTTVLVIPDYLGCKPHCPIGQDLAEALKDDIQHGHDEPAVSMVRETQAFLEEEPCQFIKEGRCRLAKYLIDNSVGTRIIMIAKGIEVSDVLEEVYGGQEVRAE